MNPSLGTGAVHLSGRRPLLLILFACDVLRTTASKGFTGSSPSVHPGRGRPAPV